MGHLVRDLKVLLCPLPLGNKFCPVEWTKSESNQSNLTGDTDDDDDRLYLSVNSI